MSGLSSFDRAIQIIADDKIRAAALRGEFDHLPGMGQPLPLLDEPYDPHWWIRRKIQRDGVQLSRDTTRGGRLRNSL